MSTTPHEIWTHAQSLPAASESEIRTKISRAYYALYSHAFEFHDALPTCGGLLKGDVGVHKQLQMKLTNPAQTCSQSEQSASRTLGTMQLLAHDLRLKADYRLGEHVNRTDLQKCLGYVSTGMAISLPSPP